MTGSYFTHAFLVMAYLDLDNLTEAKRHKQVLDFFEESPDSEKSEWQERLRRKILRTEVDAKFDGVAESSAGAIESLRR